MKILLTTLNTQYIHSNLAIKYLYESAGIYRNMIEVKEYTINNFDMQIFMDIMLGKYNIICFSCYIWNISRIIGLIKDIKKANPRVKIIVGGPEVSFEPESFLEKCPETDYVISGEGDIVFPKLITCIVEGQKVNSKIIYGESVDESDIKFPYENSDIDEDKIIYYETSRGCPHRCSFCLSSVSRGVRLLSMERIKREIDCFIKNKVKQVKFVDRTFNIDIKRSVEIMKYMTEKDNGITNFHFELCGDQISEEMLEIFENSRNGLFQVEIGVQSAHENVLRACNRKVDFEKLKKNTLRILKGKNVHVHLDLIAGLPYETYEMFKESFNCVYSMEPDDLQLGFLKLLKGTKIRMEAEQFGYVYRENEPYEVISNSFISSDELVQLKLLERVLEQFFNKPGFRNTLRLLIDYVGITPFDFYSDFSVYYTEKGYHNLSLSKNKLYDVLWSYIEEKKYDFIEGLKELILYDRILVAAPSMFSDKDYRDIVHEYLRNRISDDTGMSVKKLIKRVNYMAFNYNVDDYSKYGAELKKLKKKRLILFHPDEKNAGEEAFCEKINY